MPGLITMESSGQNGARTDHDRDPATHNVNGASEASSQVLKDNAKSAAATEAAGSANVSNNQSDPRRQEPIDEKVIEQNTPRMNDLPDEIPHIQQGFVPLSLFLTRLAQTTHNALQDKIAELARMPPPASSANGSSSYVSSAPDDSSTENLRRKGALLHFAHDWHAKWVKALVIAEWSRNAHLVSKLIDLKSHIDRQRMLYDNALDQMINVKRDLAFARMPSPDLKTALQVLSTGQAPWMPDLQYIEPPPLTLECQTRWVNELNILLSLRLNLDEFEKIPLQFRDYNIDSGRVTFRVEGEFEVDLTIADEDFEKQFWFIDFRYAFTPATPSIPQSLRNYLEVCVNDVLGREGLQGCYQFLHEFVLTSKINELKRQALQLSRANWTGTLNVESLNRALALQYWTARSNTTKSKSWILIAVNNAVNNKGKSTTGSPVSTTSQLVVTWHRDGKEVQDVDLDLDVDQLSTESLLVKVIALHIEHIFHGIHSNLSTTLPSARRLEVSKTDPASSYVGIQIFRHVQVSLGVEPTTGYFAIKPPSQFTLQSEIQLNNGKNAIEDGVICLKQVRCAMFEEAVQRRSTLWRWKVQKAELTTGELRLVTSMREWNRTIWLRREGWMPHIFLVVMLGLGGDEWWLLDSNSGRPPLCKVKLLTSDHRTNLETPFWTWLTKATTSQIITWVDARELRRRNIDCRLTILSVDRPRTIEVPLSSLFPAMVVTSDRDRPDAVLSTDDQDMEHEELVPLLQQALGRAPTALNKGWADDHINIILQVIEILGESENPDGDGSQEKELICQSEATIKVKTQLNLASLADLADDDVSYDAELGQFSLRVLRKLSQPIVEGLKSRIKAVDRFVSFLEAMNGAKGTIKTESVTLRQISFWYKAARADEAPANGDKVEQPESHSAKSWRMVLDLSRDDIEIDVEPENPHLRVLDLLRGLVNSDGGMGVLMLWLPASLPALQTVNDMIAAWSALDPTKERASLTFMMRNIAWMSLTYTIWPPSTNPKRNPEVVTLQVRLRPRRGQAWWHMWQHRATAAASDGVCRALQSIWNGERKGWVGLATGAASDPHEGIVTMLTATDAVVRKYIAKINETGAATSSSANDASVVVLD